MVGLTSSHPRESETMTIAELAERLGISRTVCYELAARNALPIPALRIGRQYRFSRLALDALLLGQHPHAGDAA